MTEQNWADQAARSIAVLIDGSADPDCSEDGTPLLDDDFLVLINAWWEPLTFTMPAEVSARCWQILCDTFDPARAGVADRHLQVGPRSLVICSSQAEAAPTNTGLT
jgi:isoamylase